MSSYTDWRQKLWKMSFLGNKSKGLNRRQERVANHIGFKIRKAIMESYEEYRVLGRIKK
jgi:hypothetical protein